MAIIVDKVQKRKDIALSCQGLFMDKGMNNLTIAEVAKTAGIGKGTVYEYFKNKEDIVFEIVNTLMTEHDIEKQRRIDEQTSLKEKVKAFFSFFYDEKDEYLRTFYKEFVSISLASSNNDITEFKSNCSNRYFGWFEQIMLDGIKNKEIIPDSKNLIQGLFVFPEGLFVSSLVTNKVIDIKKEIDIYIEEIFKLIELKK